MSEREREREKLVSSIYVRLDETEEEILVESERTLTDLLTCVLGREICKGATPVVLVGFELAS